MSVSPIDPAQVTLRAMTEADLPLLQRWLARAHVARWWTDDEAGLPAEQFRALYAPAVMAAERVTPSIVLLAGRPVGYAQSYVACGSGAGWWPDETDPGVRGIDQFIAEPDLLGRGLGTALVRALLRQLFADPAVTRVQTDPDPANARAIRCYEKAGFRAQREIVTPDGPAIYMVCERPTGVDP